MRGLILLLSIAACNRGYPVMDRIREDPEYCPTWAEVRETYVNVVCDAYETCEPEYYGDRARCQAAVGANGFLPEADETFPCYDGCKIRDYLMWLQDDYPDTCQSGDEHVSWQVCGG